MMGRESFMAIFIMGSSHSSKLTYCKSYRYHKLERPFSLLLKFNQCLSLKSFRWTRRSAERWSVCITGLHCVWANGAGAPGVMLWSGFDRVDPMKSNEIQWNPAKSSEIQRNPMKSIEVKWKSNETYQWTSNEMHLSREAEAKCKR